MDLITEFDHRNKIIWPRDRDQTPGVVKDGHVVILDVPELVRIFLCTSF